MDVKLFDSELKVMNVIWREDGIAAKHVAEELKRTYGWSPSTTYTLISRCIKKRAVERLEPGFKCHALVSRRSIQDAETDEFIDRMFGGSADMLLAALVEREKISQEALDHLCATVANAM